MGNFSISHYTALRVESDGLKIRYRLDLAEVPTFGELAALDRNGDREISAAEREAYLSSKVPELTAGQDLTVNGQAVRLSAISSDLHIRPGAGNLPTLLITIDYRADFGSLQECNVVEYSDNNFSERAGWREIIAAATDTYPLLDSTVPLNDRSGELTAHPSEATIAPPQVSRARFTFASSVVSGGSAKQASPGIAARTTDDRQRTTNSHHHDGSDHDHSPHGHSHHHHDGSDRDHSPHGHSHQIEKITWGNLLALGVSGGIVPCPSALVVLLSAIALHRIGFGLILIIAFSLGLASVLIGIGLLMLYARRLMDRFRFEGGLVKRLPIFSAAIISLLGLVIAVKSLVDGRILDLSFDLGQVNLVPALWVALGLGFVLGLKYALDADHVAAVSTIVSQHQSISKSSLVGAFWGLGHTGSLLSVGLIVIVFRLTIPERLALSLEFVVALMLVVLGVNALRQTFGFRLHQHGHRHEREVEHAHIHWHLSGAHHHEGHRAMRLVRRPLLVGMVHGLAGSAALVLLVLTTMPSVLSGLLYILAFGLGSMAGMLAMSSLSSAPFVFSARRFVRLNYGIRVAAGLFSVGFGVFLAWRIGMVERLFF